MKGYTSEWNQRTHILRGDCFISLRWDVTKLGEIMRRLLGLVKSTIPLVDKNAQSKLISMSLMIDSKHEPLISNKSQEKNFFHITCQYGTTRLSAS